MKFASIRALFLGAMMAAFSISVCLAQEVRTDWDKHANFERYHTYCWGKIQTSNQLWQSRIQDAVDKSLQAKGWQRSESQCDITVTAVGSTQNQQEYQTFYDGWAAVGGGGDLAANRRQP